MLENRPVVLIHGYEDFDHEPNKPDVSGRLQALAVSELIRRDLIDKAVIFTAATVEGRPPVANQIYDQIVRNLRHLDRGRVIVNPVSITTRGEISNFKRMAEEKKWENIASIGKDAHLGRIKRAVRRIMKKEIPVISQEEILRKFGYGRLVSNWSLSPDEAAFKKREKWVNRIDAIPLIGGPALEGIQRVLKNKKLQELALKFFKTKSESH